MGEVFVEEAVRVVCENGNEIMWDDILAFRTFKTLSDALAYVKEKRLDVFSYYKNELLCVTFLSKLIDFNHLRRDIMLPILQHLLDDAKQRGVLEKCAQSPCWVSVEHSVVYKPIAVLLSARDLVHFVPYLVVLYDFNAWCVRNKDVKRNTFEHCKSCNSYDYLPDLLDCIRPPMTVFNTDKKRYTFSFWQVIDGYESAGDVCRAMVWCCSRQNMGGVWDDLRHLVAERWDYRVDSAKTSSSKRIKL
jgi:hypothetical protein